jgi:hypothetical protein
MAVDKAALDALMDDLRQNRATLLANLEVLDSAIACLEQLYRLPRAIPAFSQPKHPAAASEQRTPAPAAEGDTAGKLPPAFNLRLGKPSLPALICQALAEGPANTKAITDWLHSHGQR